MLWLLTKLFKYLLVFAIAAVLVSLAIVLFFNPNNYKDSINHLLIKYTGKNFQVDGNIRWAIHPSTVLFLQDVTLPNPTDPKNPTLHIDEVDIYINPFSIFKGNLIINSLELYNLKFNWMRAKGSSSNINMSRSTDSDQPTSTYVGGPTFIVQNLNVKNADIVIKDEDANLDLEIKNVTMSADSLMFNSDEAQPIAIDMTGTLVDLKHNITSDISATIKPNMAKVELNLDPVTINWSDIQLKGTAAISQLDTQPRISGAISIPNTDFSGLIKKMNPYLANTNMPANHSFALQTSYDYDAEQQVLDLTNFALKLDNGQVKGNSKMGLVSPYSLDFELMAENIDFEPIKLLFDSLFPHAPSDKLLPINYLQNLDMTGKFSGTKLHLNDGLQIDEITLQVSGKSGIIQIEPFTFSSMGSLHNLRISIDVVSKGVPYFKIDEEASNVSLDAWLKHTEYGDIISGNAAIKASLEALGNTVDELKRSLSGSVNMYVKNGVLHDVDLKKLMQFTVATINDVFKQLENGASEDVYTLLRQKSSGWIDTQKDNPQTSFDTFVLKSELAKGGSTKTNIDMNNSEYELKGNGGYDLINDKLTMDGLVYTKTNVTSDVQDVANFIQQTPLPLAIGGTIDKPTFGPNIQNYAVSVINLAEGDILNKALTIMLANSPTNGNTSKTASEIFLDSLQGLR